MLSVIRIIVVLPMSEMRSGRVVRGALSVVVRLLRRRVSIRIRVLRVRVSLLCVRFLRLRSVRSLRSVRLRRR